MTTITKRNILDTFTLTQWIAGICTLVSFFGIMGTVFNQYSDVKYKLIVIENNQAEMKIELAKSKIESQQGVKNIEINDRRQDLDNAKIDARLANIEVVLQEIKQKLK